MFAAFPFAHVDWNSTQEVISFMEDDLVISGIPLFKSSVIIFDIKAFDIEKRRTENFGFAVYPLI